MEKRWIFFPEDRERKLLLEQDMLSLYAGLFQDGGMPFVWRAAYDLFSQGKVDRARRLVQLAVLLENSTHSLLSLIEEEKFFASYLGAPNASQERFVNFLYKEVDRVRPLL